MWPPAPSQPALRQWVVEEPVPALVEKGTRLQGLPVVPEYHFLDRLLGGDISCAKMVRVRAVHPRR